jgi:hypothetical protein
MDYNIKIRAERVVDNWAKSNGVYVDLSKTSRKMLIREIASEMERSWVDGLQEGEKVKKKWGGSCDGCITGQDGVRRRR